LNLGPIDDHQPDQPEEKVRMDITGLGPIGAGFAALGVIGPGIGIGILTGLAAQAIGRNPDATPQIRAQFILGAAFAEGLGVLAIVVAILALVLK
jgi:F-type H+-transporting ATPase subunit c